MSLRSQHIENIDLFLNSKYQLGVEVADISTGEVLNFDSRSKFLDHIALKNGFDEKKKVSLTGSLVYHMLIDRPFYGYDIQLIEKDGRVRGKRGKSFSRHTGAGLELPHRIGDKRKTGLFLLDAKNREVKKFDLLSDYKEYASKNGLIVSIKLSHIKGIKKVGDHHHVVIKKRYLDDKLSKKYYWVKGHGGKFEKGFSKFDELANYLNENNLHKIRSAISNGTEVGGKRIILRREIDYSMLKRL